MGKEYPLNPSSSVQQIVDVLALMRDECRERACAPAITSIICDSQKHREEAIAFMAKEKVLRTLHWALSGRAEAEGCKSTVEVYL